MTSTSEPKRPRPWPERPEPDPMASDRRAARRERRLGPEAACAVCGEKEPTMLTPVRKHLLEEHHAAGADNGSVTVVLCLNHHAKMTAGQLDAGVLSKDPAPSFIERLMRALWSLGVFFDELALTFYGWADQLAVVVMTLDQHLPIWRTLPGLS